MLAKSRSLGMAVEAYSPLGQGVDLDHPVIAALAGKRGATPAQISLAWLLAQGDDVVPIPGTKRRTYLEENVGALAAGPACVTR